MWFMGNHLKPRPPFTDRGGGNHVCLQVGHELALMGCLQSWAFRLALLQALQGFCEIVRDNSDFK